VYDLFLRRETFFNYNRIYLLLTSVSSIVLPFVKLPELRKVTTQETVIRLPEVFIGDASNTTSNHQVIEHINDVAITSSQLPVWQIVLYIGMALATLVFAIKIVKLYLIKNNNPKRWKGNILIVNLLKSSAAFSFFNTVFLGANIPNSERNTIYEHELVHVREKHSVDLLFFEILRILFWFSPLVYVYQNRVKELHEFIADAKAVKHQGKSGYYQSLLHQILDVNTLSFTNTFFKKSLIKKRIIMLQKSKSSQKSLFKYALLLPVIFSMLVYTSTEVKAQEKSDVKAEVHQELTDEEVQIRIYYEELIKKYKDLTHLLEITMAYDYTEKKYIPTRDEYLRYVAYTRFIGLRFKEFLQKAQQIKPERINRFDEMISFNRPYQNHLEYLKTDEAKRSYNESADNRTLRVITDDINNLTTEEHHDALEKAKDVLQGSFYRKLIVSDDSESIIITKDNYDGIIQLLTSHEIKKLLEKSQTRKEASSNYLDEVPFHIVDQAPSHKDCENLISKEEKKQCFSEFVNDHVKKHFNTNVEKNAELHKRRIFTRFLIDTDGNITRIQARAASKVLEEEAIRVLSLLPQFIPGRQKGEVVAVPFALPIVLNQK
jgi:beta-lactamase regulating signal transducer with metallopeptidase domain